MASKKKLLLATKRPSRLAPEPEPESASEDEDEIEMDDEGDIDDDEEDEDEDGDEDEDEATNGQEDDDDDEDDEDDDEAANGQEDDDEDDEDEDEDEQEAPSKAVYNKEALQAATRSISFMGGSAPWIESLLIDYPLSHTQQDIGANDDLAREMAFYRQALECATKAQARFESLGVPYMRPEDYFAEMVKDDKHMARVRRALLEQKQRIEAVESRKRSRDLKKYGKQVQAEKQQKAAKQKAAEQEKIKQWKGRLDTRLDDNDEFPIALEEDDASKIADRPQLKRGHGGSGGAGGGAKPGGGAAVKVLGKKRQYKNEKYGFGGPKKMQKKNTRESVDDESAFSARRNKTVDRDLHHLVVGKDSNKLRRSHQSHSNRPGKLRRKAMRGKAKRGK